jgi:hypothetical protein
LLRKSQGGLLPPTLYELRRTSHPTTPNDKNVEERRCFDAMKGESQPAFLLTDSKKALCGGAKKLRISRKKMRNTPIKSGVKTLLRGGSYSPEVKESASRMRRQNSKKAP